MYNGPNLVGERSGASYDEGFGLVGKSSAGHRRVFAPRAGSWSLDGQLWL